MRFRLPLLVICLLATTTFAQNGGTAKSPIEEAFAGLEYRSIGPAIMGGRIADVEGVPGDPNVGYVASASGGLWKTTNGGVTGKPSFERKTWTHRSGSEKGGVYKSIDGGRTWNKLSNGLPKLIGRIGIRVAPSNPNVVYAILEAKEGTLYRSDDRGETFKLISKNTD